MGPEQLPRKQLAQLQEMRGYTYVSLCLGRPFMERWEVCSNACHITIGYVALMTDREMQALLDILSHMLADWKRLAPEERPHNLIRCRKFRVKELEEVLYEVQEQ